MTDTAVLVHIATGATYGFTRPNEHGWGQELVPTDCPEPIVMTATEALFTKLGTINGDDWEVRPWGDR